MTATARKLFQGEARPAVLVYTDRGSKGCIRGVCKQTKPQATSACVHSAGPAAKTCQ